MTCREFLESVDALALDEVATDPASALRSHAAACPSCAAALSDARALDDRLHRLRASYALPPGLREKALEVIGASMPALRPAPRWTRLWRWAPAAAAALLVAAVAALFLAGPGPSVPAVVADTLAAYDNLPARGASPDIRSSSPETVQAYFRDRIQRDVATPCIHAGCTCPPGRCPCGLVGGCVCDVPSAGGRIPFVLYDHQGTTLALLTIDPSRLGSAVLSASLAVENRGHVVRVYESRGLSAAVCPDCNPGHLWVSRLPRQELVDAFHAALADRHDDGGR